MADIKTTDHGETTKTGGLRFFRAGDAAAMDSARDRGTLRHDYVQSDIVSEGLRKFASGASDGALARVIYSSDDMHISYAWFKSGFPLPLHSHDADCFYQIIAGSMAMGTEELKQGDGVLVRGGTPYSFDPGVNGVEFIEIRPTDNYDTRYRGKTEAYWNRIVDMLAERKSAWAIERPPYNLMAGPRRDRSADRQ